MHELLRQAATAALVTGSLTIGAFADEPAPTGPKIDPKADEVVKKLVEHYKKLDRMSCKMAFDVSAPGEEDAPPMNAKFDFAVEEPNRLAMRITEGEMGFTHVSDGTTMFTFAPMQNMYMKADAPKGLDGFLTEEGMMLNVAGAGEAQLLIGLLTDKGYDNLLADVSELTWVGDGKVGDTATHRIKLVRENNMDLDLQVAAEGAPWIVQFVPDVNKMLAQMGDPRQIDATLTMTEWKSDSFAEGTFAFTPPESATLYDPSAEPEMPEPVVLEDKPAPDFTLPVLGSEASVTLADHKGKDIVVIDFWATWCGPCVRGLPIVDEVTKAYADKNVVFYAVDLGEDPKKVSGFMADKKWNFNVLLDRSGSVANLYGAVSIPMTVIVSKDGIVEAVHNGVPADLNQLRTQLKNELDGLIANGKL